MSATITYKGETLTTVENETKILETKGTWLEDDITIVDSSSGGGGDDATVDILFYQDENGYIVIGDDYIPTAMGVSF